MWSVPPPILALAWWGYLMSLARGVEVGHERPGPNVSRPTSVTMHCQPWIHRIEKLGGLLLDSAEWERPQQLGKVSHNNLNQGSECVSEWCNIMRLSRAFVCGRFEYLWFLLHQAVFGNIRSHEKYFIRMYPYVTIKYYRKYPIIIGSQRTDGILFKSC